MAEPYVKETWRGVLYNQSVFDSESGAACDNLTAPPYGPPSTYSWKDSLNGFKNPRWRIQVARGENATTSMDASSKEFIFSEGYIDFSGNVFEHLPASGKRRVIARGMLCGIPSFPLNASGIPTGTAENEAAGAWYGAVRNKMSTFKGSVFAAESRQAQQMMWTRATKMLSMIPPWQATLKRQWLRSRTKRGKLKTLANNWIELQFGWLPLASDIKDAYKALNNPTPQFKIVGPVYGTHRTESKTLNGAVQNFGIARTLIDEWDITFYQVKYVGSIRARKEFTGDKLLDFGLGVREFLPTLWEVIPWSFAVDYFTNVGSIINAVSYANVDVRWVCKNRLSERSRRRRTAKAWLVLSGGFNKHEDVNVPSSFEAKAKLVQRDSTGVPIPSLQFKIPSLKQGLNLAALAVSRRLRLSY